MPESTMNLAGKLLRMQQTLKAPKGQYNSFGKYKYRSCEDILEALKPVAAANGCVLYLSDTLERIGERYYICATATLTDLESEACIQNTAYAREEESKKGMDGSQITGTASSYARKYALNGLFCIDDAKDADTDEYHKQNHPEVEQGKACITEKQQKGLKKFVVRMTGSAEEAQRQFKALTGWEPQDLPKMQIREYEFLMKSLLEKTVTPRA